MLTGIKVGTVLTAIAAATMTAFAPVHAEQLPLDITVFIDAEPEGVYKEISSNIPVNDTTQPVYGGVVRYYDVAIAQAVAITYQLCRDRNEEAANLLLTAGNQRQIDMGSFDISCNLAYDLVSAYGLNESVTRPVKNIAAEYVENMPSLNLNTDAKARRFVSFSSNFKPVKR
jgi:hypothetical protein